MKSALLKLTVLSCCIFLFRVVSAQSIEEKYHMKQYFMVFLSKGPDRSQDSITQVKLMKGHLDNIERLFQEKKLVLAGPFLDEGDIQGIFIFDVPNRDETEKLVKTDPAVQAGRFSYEIRPWYGPGTIEAR